MSRRAAPLLLVSATGVRYVGQVAVLAAIAHSGGAEAVGRFTLALAIAAPAFVALDLGMRDLRMTLRTPIAAARYAGLRAVTSGLVVAVTLATVLIVSPESALLFTAVCIQKVCDQVNDLRSAFLQIHGRYRSILGIAAASTLCQIATISCTTALGMSPDVCVLASAIAAAIGMTATASPLDRTRRRRLGTDLVPSRQSLLSDWRILLRAGIPTGIAFGLSTLTTTIPQYALSAFRGPDAAGHLAVLLYVVVAVQIIGNALAQTWIPQARTLDGSHGLRLTDTIGTSLRWLRWTGPAAALIALASSVAFPLVFDSRFVLSWDEALPIVACGVFLAPMLATSTALAVRNLYGSITAITAASVATSALLSVLLVPAAGTQGALWSCAAVIAVRSIAGGFLLRSRSIPLRTATT